MNEHFLPLLLALAVPGADEPRTQVELLGIPQAGWCYTAIGVLTVVIIAVRSCGYHFQRRPARPWEHIGTVAGIFSFAGLLASFFWNVPVASMVAVLALLGLYAPDLRVTRKMQRLLLGLLLSLFLLLPIAGFFMSWGVLKARGSLGPAAGIAVEELKAKHLKFVNRNVSIDLQLRAGHYDVHVPPYDSRRIRFEMDSEGVACIQVPVTGRDSGVYGCVLLSCAVCGLIAGLGNAFRPFSRWLARVILAAALLGIATLSAMRMNPGVQHAWGPLSQAISDPAMFLGYPLGPGLSLAGFLMAAVVALIEGLLAKTDNPRAPLTHRQTNH